MPFNNADIMLNVCGTGRVNCKLGNIAHAAGGIQLALSLKHINKGDVVDELAGVVKGLHGGKNVPVGNGKKVLRIEHFKCFFSRKGGQKNAAQNGFFGIRAVRHGAVCFVHKSSLLNQCIEISALTLIRFMPNGGIRIPLIRRL